MKAMTFWVKPQSSIEALPEAKDLVQDLLELFYEYFPEYEGCLGFSQSPRRPRYLFLYMEGPCGGLLPSAASFLKELLQTAFPGAEVRVYGKPWP
ncbi:MULTISPECIES: hypothetical protein [Thermus]|uniref:hypothetical protein n=1 Tax=Thermus TaxID=270 RepID=UPI001F3D14AE|nr:MULTISPECIES: hypothetical protein [Thermus]